MQSKRLSPQTSSRLAQRARRMRLAPTWSEAALWRALSGRKLGVQVRRQVVVGRYIVDFAVQSARVVIEVDGGCHQRRLAADARRDRALRRAGWRVLRLEAELVCQRLPEALAKIREALGDTG